MTSPWPMVGMVSAAIVAFGVAVEARLIRLDGKALSAASVVSRANAAVGVDVPHELKGKFRRPDRIPAPKANPLTPEKAELGRHLFFDTRLSKTGTVSCASCHNQAFDWSDGLQRGIGVTGVELPRRSPTVLNAAWLTALMWDGRAETLERQAALPLTAEHEMGMTLEDAVERVKHIEGYAPLFEAAYPGEGVTTKTLLGAFASFQRTLVSNRSAFDRWIEGDEGAISDAAKRGFLLFNGDARCSKCHSTWRFTDDSFHDIGLKSEDIGRGQFAPPSVTIMQHAFKTPTLRDVRMSGPYMHDGSMQTLDAVIDHYEDGGNKRPSLSPEMKPIKLTPGERSDLMAFLETLRGPPLQVNVPRLP